MCLTEAHYCEVLAIRRSRRVSRCFSLWGSKPAAPLAELCNTRSSISRPFLWSCTHMIRACTFSQCPMLIETHLQGQKCGVVQSCNPSPWEAEAGVSDIKGHPWLHKGFDANLGYMQTYHCPPKPLTIRCRAPVSG